ncbi:MAG TPA: glycosyltransferase family 39 protein [Ktedonobacteraceae bacterium]|nr:glycosyltransferase family 39 protein [Ktedonobacteraceae bacterium]
MIDATSSQQLIKTKKITRKRRLAGVTMSRLSLPLILVFQALLSLILLRNTAFQDEALYLFAGREIVNGWLGLPHFPVEWAYFLSGYAYFYPVIGGTLAIPGGVELARMFSLLCMMSATVCVYYETKHFFDHRSAILAALLFAFQGPVLFIGRLATYDALCLVLIALAVVLALHVSRASRPWAILGIGPLLVLAILAKFAGLLFLPIPFAMLIWCSLERQGWRKMLVRLGMALCSLAITSVVAYAVLDKSALHAVIASTTSRDVIVKTAPLFLIQYIVTLAGVAFALGLLGLLLGGRRRLLTGLLLFGSSLLVPVYHIYEGELISLHKHLAFSMLFITPLAGFAVARIINYRHHLSFGRYWLAGLALCLISFSSGVSQAQTLYGAWASSTNMISAMQTQVRLGSGRYMAEDFDVCRYYLQSDTDLWQWSSLDFFEYTDKGGHYLVGKEAYHAAIYEGYFAIAELSYGYNAALAVFIGQELAASRKYQLIDKIPNSNSYGTGYFWIWRKL